LKKKTKEAPNAVIPQVNKVAIKANRIGFIPFKDSINASMISHFIKNLLFSGIFF
jgi:hypothetical protein